MRIATMLTALGPQNTVVSVADSEQELRRLSSTSQLFCRLCSTRVIYRHGRIRQRHFAHFDNSTCVESVGELDGSEHQAMKLAVFSWLKDHYPTADVDMEALIETGQRVDVLLTMPDDGERVAFEVEYRGLTTIQWQERKRLYQSVGIKTVWLFHQRWYDWLTPSIQPHSNPVLSALGGHVGLIRLDDLHRELRRANHQLLYLCLDGPDIELTYVTEIKPSSTTTQFHATTFKTALTHWRIQSGKCVWPALENILAPPPPKKPKVIAPLPPPDHDLPPHDAEVYEGPVILPSEEEHQKLVRWGQEVARFYLRRSTVNYHLRKLRIEQPMLPLQKQITSTHDNHVPQQTLFFGVHVPQLLETTISPDLWQRHFYQHFIDGHIGSAIEVGELDRYLRTHVCAPGASQDVVQALRDSYVEMLRELGIINPTRVDRDPVTRKATPMIWVVRRTIDKLSEERLSTWRKKHDLACLLVKNNDQFVQSHRSILHVHDVYRRGSWDAIITKYADERRDVYHIMEVTGGGGVQLQYRRLARALLLLGRDTLFHSVHEAEIKAKQPGSLHVRDELFRELGQQRSRTVDQIIFYSGQHGLPFVDESREVQVGYLCSLLGYEESVLWADSIYHMMATQNIPYDLIGAAAREACFLIDQWPYRLRSGVDRTKIEVFLYLLVTSLPHAWINKLSDDSSRQPEPPPAFNVAHQEQIYTRIMHHKGIVMNARIRLIGRPGAIEERQDAIIFSMQDSEPMYMADALGIPASPLCYIVYAPPRLWRKVYLELSDPTMALKIEGKVSYDPARNAMLVFATWLECEQARSHHNSAETQQDE